MVKKQTTEKSERPKKKFWKKLFRFFLFSSLIFVFVVILALLLFRIIFPPDKIRTIANNVVQKNINRQLSIGDLSVNPFIGFEFKDVALYKHPDSLFKKDDVPILSARIKSAVFKYSFKDLIKKNVHINKVIIESPTIILAVPTTKPDTTKARQNNGNPLVVLDSLTLPILPVSLALDQLTINNAELSFTQGDSINSQFINLTNLSFYGQDLNVPKGDLEEQKNKNKGRVGFECKNAHITFQQIIDKEKTLHLVSTLNLAINTDIRGLSVPNLLVDLELQNTSINSTALDSIGQIDLAYPIKLHLSMNAQADQKSLFIQPLTLLVDNQQWLELQAGLTKLSTIPLIDISLNNSKIKIAQLLEIISPIMPSGVLPAIYLHNKNAIIDITKLTANGPLPINPDIKVGPIDFAAQAQLLNFGTTVNYGDIELSSLNFSANTKGQASIEGLEYMDGSVNISYDSLFIAVNDTLDIYSGPFLLNANSEIDENMLPKNINGKLNINNVLGAQVNGQFSFSGHSFSSLKGSGSISLDKFETTQIPNMPVATTAHFSTQMIINTLDSIKIEMSANTDSVILSVPEDKLTFPPVLLTAHLQAKTDTTFKNLKISNMAIQLNNVIEARLSAKILDGTDFSFNLNTATIFHKSIFDWVPKQFNAPLEEMIFTGETKLLAEAHGRLKNKTLSYSAKAAINSNIPKLAYPPLFLSLGGLNIDINTSIRSDSGVLAHLNMTIDSTKIETMRPDPLLATTFSLKAKSPNFQSVSIDSGLLNIPALAATVRIDGSIDSLQTDISMNAHVLFEQNSPEPLAMTRDLKLSGLTSISAFIKMDTSLLETRTHLLTNNVSLFLPNETSIENMNAHLKINQDIDLLEGKLIARTNPLFNTPSPSTVDWHVLSQHYYSTIPDISNLSIFKIKAAGYQIENINLEAFIGEGIMEVPSFSANVYGGNVDGRLSFDIAGGDATLMSYSLSSHFSRINSALLLPDQGTGSGKGIINANLHLFGKGVDPNSKIDLGGVFYITQIGPKVANNLLRSLDPEGADLGIKMTRWFIDQGFKPKLFTFMIRNNYFYPTVEFNQPIYFPVRLSGGRVELNRMPAKFFIQSALKNAQLQKAKN